MGAVLGAIQTIVDAEDRQITIRHLYYRLVGLGVIEKTEPAYKSLCQHLSKWRRTGDIEWSAFTDSTRWHIKDSTFDGIHDALENSVATYRRNLWDTQDVYVEVWVEKDAMAGIVSETANSFGVPVFVARGFASLSSLYSAANTFKRAVRAGKRVIVYHLGDHDPSGVAAGESMVKAFRDDFRVPVEFKRAAVTESQITALNLPTRPLKHSTHAAQWSGGECVELDTMLPADIRSIVEKSITQHIDPYKWAAMRAEEAAQRETMREYVRGITGRAA